MTLTPSVSVNYDLSAFRLAMILARTTILIYGKRGSGKTTLMCNLLSEIHKHYPLGCAIAPTATVRLELCKHMPSSLIWPEFDIDKLTTVVSEFTESTMPNWMEYTNDAKKSEEQKADILNWLLIMDDCGFSEKTFRHVTFNNMYMNGRQVGQGIILNLQRLRSIGPQLRGQLDYVFLFRDLSKSVQESIHQDFFSFLDFKAFKSLYMRYTEGYNCVVLDVQKAQRIRDLGGHSPKSITECMFVYSPKAIHQIPPFAMFHPFIWKLDIAWKRLLKKRALTRSLTINQVGGSGNGDGQRIQTPRSPSVVDPVPIQSLSEVKDTQERKEKELKLPKTTRYSGYPISTFSSLKSIPTPLPTKSRHSLPRAPLRLAHSSMLRPSKTQIAHEKVLGGRKHASERERSDHQQNATTTNQERLTMQSL